MIDSIDPCYFINQNSILFSPFLVSPVWNLDSTSDQDFSLGAGHRTCGFGRVSYGTESKRTEAGGGRQDIFFLVALHLFHPPYPSSSSPLLLCFFFLTFTGTGPGMHAFV